LASPELSEDPSGRVADRLLLATLAFLFFPSILVLDVLDWPPMLPAGSLAVTPLSPVDVGEGCSLRDEDLEGTGSSPWFFFVVSVPAIEESSSGTGAARVEFDVFCFCPSMPNDVLD